MKLIEEGWKSFQESVFGDEPVSPMQREEMRKAFYCGAGLLQLVIEMWGGFSVHDQLVFNHNLKDEIEEFRRQMEAEGQPETERN